MVELEADLPAHVPTLVHMSAGAIAGMLEHTAMYPFDVVKTRMQRLYTDPSSSGRGMANVFRTMYRREGFRVFYRGVGTVLMGAGPAHALYFAAYEKSKQLLGASADRPLATAASAVVATFAHDSYMNPVDVVKQRLQMQGSPYNSIRHCVRDISHTEGVGAFYRSFTTSLLMNLPFHTIYLTVYEMMRKAMHPLDTENFHAATHLGAGAVAGGIAAVVTTPLDVCKTLLNTNERCLGALAAGEPTLKGGHVVSSLVYAARTVYHQAGWSGFGRGWQARLLFTAPSGAISWTVYEAFKHFLGQPVEDTAADPESVVRISAAASSSSSSSSLMAVTPPSSVPAAVASGLVVPPPARGAAAAVAGQ